MRGHLYLLSRSLHIHSISYVALPLLACPVRSPLRSSCRRAFRSSIVSRSAYPPPLAYFPRFHVVMALASYRLPPRSSLTAHRPAARVEERGDTIVLLVVMLVVSACLAWCRSCLKTLLGNLLKICLGKLLKTFTGNLLKTIRYIPLSYMSAARLSAVVSLCVAACRLAVLSRLCFELIETAHFCDSVSPRSPSRHASCVMPAVRLVFPSVGAYRSSSFASARPASRPSCRLPRTPRLTDTHGGERNGAGTVAWRVHVYMTSCGVICLAFLLFRRQSLTSLPA